MWPPLLLMHLERIHLLNFKNHEDLSLEFSPEVNGIVGPNGSGKTSLLDAIYLLALTKSAFSQTDAQCIRHGAGFFMVEGRFGLTPKSPHPQPFPQGGREFFSSSPLGEAGRGSLVTCSMKVGGRKTVAIDKKPYERLSEHVCLSRPTTRI